MEQQLKVPLVLLGATGGVANDKDKDRKQEWDDEQHVRQLEHEIDEESKFFEECLKEETEFWEECQKEAEQSFCANALQLQPATKFSALLESASWRR